MNWLAKLIIDSAGKEYSRATKSFFTTWGVVLFEFLVPAAGLLVALLLEMGLGLRQWLPLEEGLTWIVCVAMATPLILAGQVLILWTLVHQLRFSGGTPAFKAPPKKLLVDGPYRLCRNPMVMGYLAYYLGLGFAFASPLGLLVFWPMLTGLALYVTVQVEEVELARRFGDSYLAYKSSVNRMLPAWSDIVVGLRQRNRLSTSVDSLDDRGQHA